MKTSTFLLFILLFLLPVVSIAFFSSKTDPHVKLTTGRIRGYSVEPKSFGGHRVNIYKGIPFAQPPVSDLRFKFPKPVKPWFGILDATEYKAPCPSNTTRTTSPQYNASEDCLYVNVLADAACAFEKDCPVLFLIHGGGFTYDSAIMENIDFLVEHYASRGIIVVIPAYRLGIFGFIDINDGTVAPKNLGLHDLVFGLKWVEKEISNFGGDPDKVTLFGNSAGGDIVAQLSVAPGVEKTWDKIIISGPEIHIIKGSDRSATVSILQQVGCWSDTNTNATLFPHQQLACLNNRSTEELIAAQRIADDEDIVFDGATPDTLLFYGQTYAQLLDEFKPAKALLGSTTRELTIAEDMIPYTCRDFLNVFDYHSDEVLNACTDKYLDAYQNGSNVDVSADGARAQIYQIANVISKKLHPAYIYSFELEGHIEHAEDSDFIVGLHLNVTNWKDNYILNYFPKVVERFIKYGVPDEDWPAFDHGSNYKVIDVTNSSGTLRGPYSIRHSYFPEAIKTWLVDFKIIDDTVKYEKFKNKTKEALEKWEEIQEEKWERFKARWNEVKDFLEEKYEHWKEKRKNATIEIFRKFKEAQERKLEEQKFKAKQFVNFLLSHSITDVIEKVDELEEFLSPTDIKKYAALEDVKDQLKLMRKELLNESLSPEDKEKIELVKKIKQAIKDTIDDYINGKKEEEEIEPVDNVTELSFLEPKIGSLTKEEWDAAKKIFEEQRAALEARANATYQAEKEKWDKVKDEINKKINESIAEKEAYRKSIIEKWNATKQAREEKKAEIKQKINETITNWENKKQEIKDNIKQKINETIQEKKAEYEQIRETRAAEFEEFEKNKNATIQRLKDAKAEIEKDRPAVDDKVAASQEKVKAALDELKNATFAQFEERLSERKQWKSVLQELRNETFSKIFDKLKEIAQEKYKEDKEKFAKFQEVANEIKAKIKDKIVSKIIDKELGLFQGSFVALPPELQQNGGISPNSGVSPAGTPLSSELENQRLWSAFWIVLIIAFFLAFAIFAKSCFNWVRPKPKVGYFYNEDPGFFTFNEKSKIVVSNYPTYT